MLMQTVQVQLINKASDVDSQCRVRALLDGGSECSFVSRRVAEDMHAPVIEVSKFAVVAFGGTLSSHEERQKVEIILKSQYTDKKLIAGL